MTVGQTSSIHLGETYILYVPNANNNSIIVPQLRRLKRVLLSSVKTAQTRCDYSSIHVSN